MSRCSALSILLAAFGLFYLLPLATHGLWIPDETRYAQISQEMLLSGNWVAPHFMGLRYFEKPAGGYWMIAASQALFGSTLFGVRFASALSMGLSVLLAYCMAGRLWNDPRRSLACAVVFMSCGLVAGQADYMNLDPQFTLWANLSLVALWYALTAVTTRARVCAWALLGLACGMGFLVKGFLALLLPVLVALPYMAWRKRIGELLGFGLIAVAVAGLVALPWVIAVHRLEPDFWRFFFWHENIRRFAGQDAQHAEPWWYYLPLIVVACAPWILLLPTAFKQAWRERARPQAVFLLLWLLLPLAFFSVSRGKLPSYILPCMLPLALLIGHALVSRLEESKVPAIRYNGLFNLLVGAVGLIAVVVLQIRRPIYDHEPLHLALILIGLCAWIIASALQASRPKALWMAPAVGMGVLLGVVPASLPNSIVYSKTPDTFIAEHAAELASSHTLLANDLGGASALAWHAYQPQVGLYNTDGETQYGLAYPDVHDRAVSLANVSQWMNNARKAGSVGVVMRIKGDDELHEVALLPKDGQRYEQGSMIILLYGKSP